MFSYRVRKLIFELSERSIDKYLLKLDWWGRTLPYICSTGRVGPAPP
jgi:hypothetical protein